MPELDWYPVDPGLNAHGAYSALESFPRARELKPVALGAGKKHLNKWEQLESAQALRVAFNLGVGAMFQAGFSHEGHSFTFAGTWCEAEITAAAPHGGLIYGTRWGAGIRIHVRTSTISGETSVNLTTLAAESELGIIQAEYTIETFGVTDIGVLGHLPVPGRLDTAAAAKFLDAADAVKLLKSSGQLTPVPFEVYAPTSYFQTPVYNALSLAFAASRIARGVSYADALTEATVLIDQKISPLKVHELYHRWGVSLDDKPPSKSQRDKARNFLSV